MAEVNLAEINFGGAVGDRQTTKLNSPPNVSAIRYIDRQVARVELVSRGSLTLANKYSKYLANSTEKGGLASARQ